MDEKIEEIFKNIEEFLKKLAYIEKIEYIDTIEHADKSFTAIHSESFSIFLDFSSAIDIPAEIEKLNKEKQRIIAELKRANGMLSNQKFVEKAPQKLIEAKKEKVVKYQELLQKVENRLKDLESNS